VWTDGGRAAVVRAPAPQDRLHFGEHAFEVSCLLLEQRPDVDARRRATTPQFDDLANLAERQPEPSCLADEGEHSEDIRRIEAIARPGAPRRGHDAPRFIEPQGLATDSAPCRHCADQETVLRHKSRIDLAPWGKVKPNFPVLQ
jgi:hypothetical protein